MKRLLISGVAIMVSVWQLSSMAGAAIVAAEKVAQEKVQSSSSAAADLKAKEAGAQSMIDAKNLVVTNEAAQKVSNQVLQATMLEGLISDYDFAKPYTLGRGDPYAIYYAYDRGGNAVGVPGVTISFVKKDGKRISRDEVTAIVNALKTAPGTSGAEYWKNWEWVRYVNGQYYWSAGPSGQRTMTSAELALYFQWEKSQSGASVYSSVIKKYNFKDANLQPSDVFAINYAYERGGTQVVLHNITINFTKSNGKRLTKDELNMVIKTLKTAPGTLLAQYWKKWKTVKLINGQYYWPNAPAGQRTLSPIEVQLYKLWMKR